MFVAERARQGGRGAMRLLAFGERAGLWNLRARILHVETYEAARVRGASRFVESACTYTAR